MKKIKRVSKKPLIMGIAILIILAALSGLYYLNHSSPESKQTQATSQGGKANLAPATEEEKQDAEQAKQDIVDRDQQLQNQPPETGKKAVKPIITYAGQYAQQIEVGAYVSGIFEEGGTCAAVFVNGSNKVTKSVTAVRGANSVDCPVMSAAASEFSPKGSWSVTVNYNSPAASGGSEVRTLEVK